MKSFRCTDDSSKSLPDELVEEILVRLPARSLVRFKRVCKWWNSIINDPSFVNNHLQLNIARTKAACSDHDLVSNLIMGWTWWDRSSFDFTDQLSKDDELDQKQMLSLIDIYAGEKAETEANGLLPCRIVDIPLPLHPKVLVEDEGYLMPLQSYHCNGILCLVDPSPFFTNRLAFYNPALAKFRLLPTPETPSDFMETSHGFGYDPRTNDYKFVRISTAGIETGSTHVDVYTLRANSWKTIRFDVCCRPYPRGGVYLGSSYYWILMGTTDSESILAFDTSKDEFSTFGTPFNHHYRGSRGRLWSALAVWNESLMYFYSPEEGVFKMWVKGNNSNGEGLVWTKHSTIGPLEGTEKPVIFWKNDKLLMEDKYGTMMSYDLCTKKLTKVPMDGAVLPQFAFASSYVESLVPV